MRPIVKLMPYDATRFFHIPTYASDFSSGKDIKASIEQRMVLLPGDRVLVPTNLKVEIPEQLTRTTFGQSTFLGVTEDREYKMGTDPSFSTSLPQNTGFRLELQIRAKSGVAHKQGLIVTNGIGTIDADYRGEIMVALTNVSRTKQVIEPKQFIAQIVLAPVLNFGWEVVGDMTETERNEKGFGEQTASRKPNFVTPMNWTEINKAVAEGATVRIDPNSKVTNNEDVLMVDIDNIRSKKHSDTDKPQNYSVPFSTYLLATKLGFCMNCGRLEMTEYFHGNNTDICKYFCHSCHEKVDFPKDIHPYVKTKESRSACVLKFSPVYPTEEQIAKMIRYAGLSDTELFHLRKTSIDN